MPNANILFQNQPTAPLTAHFKDALNTAQQFNDYQQMPTKNRLLDAQVQGVELGNDSKRIRQQSAQYGIDRQQQLDQVSDMAADAYELLPLFESGDQFQVMDKLKGRVDKITQSGGDPSDTIDFMTRLQNGSLSAEQAKAELSTVIGKAQQLGVFGSPQTAAIRDFKSKAAAAGLVEGTPEYEHAAKVDLGVVARAGSSAAERAATNSELGDAIVKQGAKEAAATEDAKVRAKLMAELDLKPSIQKRVEEAVASVKTNTKISSDERSNERAFSVYESSISGLVSALDGANTGPMIGWLPALTANQQIADGAVAVMAPVLKGIFRTSGEGTFTDKDQAMLLTMIPTRSTAPEARASQLAMVDAVVRSKMGQPVMVPSSVLGREVSMGEVFNEAVNSGLSIEEVRQELGIQ